MNPTAPRRVRLTVVHSAACHLCDDAREALDAMALERPLDVTIVDVDSPAGAALVVEHRPTMNPLVLVDGEYFSSGRLPRKTLTRLLDRLGQEPAPTSVRTA